MRLTQSLVGTWWRSRFSQEALALFARMTPEPSAARKTLINDLIVSLKNAGIWTKLDCLYVLAAHDAQAAQRNWKADQFNLTAVNSPTFTVDRGYTGDGSTSYLDTGWDPVNNGVNFVQNSADLFIWSRSNTREDKHAIGTTGAYINTWNLSIDTMSHALNAAADNSFPPGAADGLFLLSRLNSAEYHVYRNATLLGTRTVASLAPPSIDFRICASDTLFSAREYAAAGFGGGLTSTEEANLHSALNTYLVAVGAA